MDAIWNALEFSVVPEPVLRALWEIGVAGNLFRCRSFHYGTLAGALLVIAGFCQLCMTTPTLFLDIVLGYIFYKLSILAAELRRNGKSFKICARIQLVLIFISIFRNKGAFQGMYHFVVKWIWDFSFHLYFFAVVPEMTGVKYLRYYWLGVCRTLQTKGSLMKVLQCLTIDTFGGPKKRS